MSDSVDILKKLALQVRNASTEGENTAERIGRIFIGILENMDNSDIEKLTKYFLRKDKEDSTNFLLSLLGGVLIKNYAKFGDFIPGVSGGYIGEDARAELEALAALGVDYVQGYFLARPALLPPPVTPEGAECLRALL